MEMDVYDMDSYTMSLSNLFTLKLFHDYGVNVSNFDNPMVHINGYQDGNSLDIFVQGIRSVFQGVETYDFNENKSEEFQQKYGVSSVELVIIISNPLLKNAIEQDETKVMGIINDCWIEFHDESVSMSLLPSKEGISICVEYVHTFHEITEALLELHKVSIDINKCQEVPQHEVGSDNRLDKVA